MLVHDGPRHPKPETTSLEFLGRDERLEYLCLYLRVDAGPRVANGYDQSGPISHADGPRSEADKAVLSDSVDRVFDKILKYLA